MTSEEYYADEISEEEKEEVVRGHLYIMQGYRSWWIVLQSNGNFPLHHVVKMSLHMWLGGSKEPQNTLT